METSDQQLVAQYLETRDSRVFAQLVSRYLKLVYTIGIRLSHNADDAQDISQEVFVKIWRYLSRFDQTQPFQPWIARIAKNTALDWVKKKRPFVFSGLDREEINVIDALVDPQPRPDEISIQKQQAEELERTINHLPVSYAEVIRLHYGQGLSFQEIADQRQMIMDTVKTRHRRALLLIKKWLGKSSLDEPK